MSCHEGVSCDNCLRSNFEGKRYKCLICYDYDLCESCHEAKVATARHTASHPMQCILTRSDFDKHYRGELIGPETPPSLVCPFCNKLGLTEALLQDHVVKEHSGNRTEVLCPVCATLPSGDPNLVSDDLAHHLAMDHRIPRNAEESIASRHVRRRGVRARNFRSGHGLNSQSNSTSSGLSNSNPPSLRDSIDPIAELLTQLSGVRRSAQQLQQNVNTASQLHELQTQLQLERQRASDIRQQLERFPSKSTGQNTNSFTGNSGWSATSKAPANPAKNTVTVQSSEEDDAKFLLSRLDSLNLSDHEKQENEKEDVERSHFVQELLLSMLSVDPENSTVTDNIPAELHLGNTERATPVQCPLLSKTATNSSGSSIQKTDSSFHRKDPIQPSSRSLRKSTNETNSPEFDPLHKQSNDAPSESLLHSSDQSQTFVSRQTQFGSSFGGGEKDNIDGMSPGAMPPCRMQHMYAPGSVRLAGGSGTAALSSFSRDDVSTTDVIAKHVH